MSFPFLFSLLKGESLFLSISLDFFLSLENGTFLSVGQSTIYQLDHFHPQVTLGAVVGAVSFASMSPSMVVKRGKSPTSSETTLRSTIDSGLGHFGKSTL